MGTLVYGCSQKEIFFEGRALVHLQIVIAAKLRRSESFFLTWVESGSSGIRRSIWIDRSVPLQMAFTTSEALEPVNRLWLSVLMDAANSAQGLRLIPEPDDSSCCVDPPLERDLRRSTPGAGATAAVR